MSTEAKEHGEEAMAGVQSDFNPLKRKGNEDSTGDQTNNSSDGDSLGPEGKRQRRELADPATHGTSDDKIERILREMKHIGSGVEALQVTSTRLESTTAKLEQLSETTCLKLTEVRERLHRVEDTAAKAEVTVRSVQTDMITLKNEVALLKTSTAAASTQCRTNECA